jgi:hypothetical protein
MSRDNRKGPNSDNCKGLSLDNRKGLSLLILCYHKMGEMIFHGKFSVIRNPGCCITFNRYIR